MTSFHKIFTSCSWRNTNSKYFNSGSWGCYARKQLLLSARLGHHNSVCLSICSSVRHTPGSVKNSAR